jgi:geranylgeranyl diphosphate synthase, type II
LFNPLKALSLIAPYKERIENELRKVIETLGSKTPIHDAIEYALLGQGKRFRPTIVYMVAEALGKEADVVTPSAVAVEVFHTASLIADDLPCMDNDDFRRGKPTVHKAFGETVALLSGLSLFAIGYDYIAKNATKNKELCGLAVSHAARINGYSCLISGQYLDIFPKSFDKEGIYEIIEKKTASLFELSFLLGWIFADGEHDKIPLVQKLAFSFGAAFQILDDIDDMKKDEEGKRKVNFANLFGKDEAKKAVQKHIAEYKEILSSLKINTSSLLYIGDVMNVLCSAL